MADNPIQCPDGEALTGLAEDDRIWVCIEIGRPPKNFLEEVDEGKHTKTHWLQIMIEHSKTGCNSVGPDRKHLMTKSLGAFQPT